MYTMENPLEQMLHNMAPANQLKLAVACNMTELLERALAAGVDVNIRASDDNGDSPLHAAARKGHDECVQQLLAAGARPDEPNDCGLTPLALALRYGHVRCVRLLYETGSALSDPRMVWSHHTALDGVPMWAEYTAAMMLLLLVATPDLTELAGVGAAMWEHHLEPLHHLPLIRMFILTGNRLRAEQMAHLLSKAEGDAAAASLRGLQGAQSLQQYARVAIRRCLRPNTLWAAPRLPLPAKLQQYLLFDEET